MKIHALSYHYRTHDGLSIKKGSVFSIQVFETLIRLPNKTKMKISTLR